MLLQEHESGDFRPTGYWNRTLNDAEKKYNTTQKECLAVVWAVLMLRPYVERTPFIAKTDHQSLRWIINLKESTGRLTCCQLCLMEFDIEIQHRSGRRHMAADTLSRLPTNQIDISDIDDDIPAYEVDEVHTMTDFNMKTKVVPMTRQSLSWAQKEDTNCL